MAQGRASGARQPTRPGRVNARAVEVGDLPSPLPSLVLVVGDEELLVSRAVAAVATAATGADPDMIEIERPASAIEGPELHELVGPALFGGGRLVIIRDAQDLRAAAQEVFTPYLAEPGEGTVIVVQHAGGAKGKALLEAARRAGALELPCAKITWPEERAEFVRSEVRRVGGTITPDAVAALLDAVGSDLRELSVAAAQLVSDSAGPGAAGTRPSGPGPDGTGVSGPGAGGTGSGGAGSDRAGETISGGTIDVDLVRAFHQGRAEVSGFAVADLALAGNTAGAFEALRYALDRGVPHVVIADAFADGVRTMARVGSAGRGSEYDLAKRLGMPPWKVKRAQAQSRGWSEAGVRHALRAVGLLNADVKGEAASPEWALERAILRLARARNVRVTRTTRDAGPARC